MPNEANSTVGDGERVPSPPLEVEAYRLSEIFSLIPEYEGDQIFLGTFLNACDCAYNMSTNDQQILLAIHIKNKLRGRAAQLISSRNPNTYTEIKRLLNLHFGDSRDLSSLIQDLQRLKQLSNESPLTFFSRLQVLNAKMHANIQKSPLNPDQKIAQTTLIETMALNTLLTGLEPKIGQLIRAGNPKTLLEAQTRIRRELQLSYFETKKVEKPNLPRPSPPLRRPMPQSIKCFICGRNGHVSSQCRSQPQNYSNPFSAQRPTTQQNPMPGPSSGNNQPYYQQRPQNPNFTQHRPFIQNKNPNLKSYPQKTFHVNSDDYAYEEINNCPETAYHPNDDQEHQDLTGYPLNPDPYFQDFNGQHNYTPENTDYQDFQCTPLEQHPPDQTYPSLDLTPDPMLEIQSQIQTLNLDDMNPNLNFPEQTFL